MPLFKSKKSPSNDKDMPMPKAVGSLPIALGVQKQSKKKISMPSKSVDMPDMKASCSVAEQIRNKKKKMADGGMVDSSDDQMGLEAMKKETYADGGMVDLDSLSEESPNEFDDLNEDAADKAQYDDSQISEQPMDSNEKGHEIEDELDRSIVAAIRRKMSAKSGM